MSGDVAFVSPDSTVLEREGEGGGGESGEGEGEGETSYLYVFTTINVTLNLVRLHPQVLVNILRHRFS